MLTRPKEVPLLFPAPQWQLRPCYGVGAPSPLELILEPVTILQIAMEPKKATFLEEHPLGEADFLGVACQFAEVESFATQAAMA